MSGPPGPGPARAMSVGTNGPPGAGLPPHGGMQPQQNAGPPPPSTSGPQSQQNLNQIVGGLFPSLCAFVVKSNLPEPCAQHVYKESLW